MVPNQYTAIELWKRWFDWHGKPWTLDYPHGDREICFFCGGSKPNHDEPMCVYLSAKELVSLDEKGELG